MMYSARRSNHIATSGSSMAQRKRRKVAPGIYAQTDTKGKVSYRAYVHREGNQYSRTCETLALAKEWKATEDTKITRRGLGLSSKTFKELRKATLERMVQEYRGQIQIDLAELIGKETEFNNLCAFERHGWICSKSIYDVTVVDFDQYVKLRGQQTNRSGEPITPRTIRRELSTIQRVFEYAIRDEHPDLRNPLRGYRVKGSTKGGRKRSLQPGELEKLEEACKRCLGRNRYYAPLAIDLAVETGMRLQEIFDLKWGDIDVPKRRIEIRRDLAPVTTTSLER